MASPFFARRIYTFCNEEQPTTKGPKMAKKCKKYGLINFLIDIIMSVVTGGLWLIWIFVREMRNR